MVVVVVVMAVVVCGVVAVCGDCNQLLHEVYLHYRSSLDMSNKKRYHVYIYIALQVAPFTHV